LNAAHYRKEHTTVTTPDPLPARVRALLTDAVARLDPADRAERIAYCQAHDEHGTRMHLTDDDNLIEFRWGGRTGFDRYRTERQARSAGGQTELGSRRLRHP
jgi:hypothetical protein